MHWNARARSAGQCTAPQSFPSPLKTHRTAGALHSNCRRKLWPSSSPSNTAHSFCSPLAQRATPRAATRTARDLLPKCIAAICTFCGISICVDWHARYSLALKLAWHAPFSLFRSRSAGICCCKKNALNTTIFLDTEFSENYTFVSCNFRVRSNDV